MLFAINIIHFYFRFPRFSENHCTSSECKGSKTQVRILAKRRALRRRTKDEESCWLPLSKWREARCYNTCGPFLSLRAWWVSLTMLMLPPGEWATSIVRTRQIIVTEQTPHDEGLSRHPHAFPESTRPYACGRKVPCLGDIEFSPVMLPNIPSGSLRHRTIINTHNSTMRSKTETPLFIVDTWPFLQHLNMRTYASCPQLAHPIAMPLLPIQSFSPVGNHLDYDHVQNESVSKRSSSRGFSEDSW